MGRINVGRVILGGLVAGLVINIGETILNLVVVAQAMEDAFQARNLPALGINPIIGFVVFSFAVGIVTVWLYAAIRPRFGPGPKTGAIAGLVVWFFAYLYGAVAMGMMGLFPMKLMAITTIWGLPEIVLAAVAGASLYKE
jgi:hypothetical protein